MARVRQRCPICRKPAKLDDSWFPFCSKRCRTRDLANWATGAYSVPVPANEPDQDLQPLHGAREGETDE